VRLATAADATPSAVPSSEAYALSSALSSRWPSVERNSTVVGSAAPLGWPFWKVISAWPDSVCSVLLSEKLKVALNPSANNDRTASDPAATTA
jgi:hypothetical protein